jgi:hypothetical protein
MQAVRKEIEHPHSEFDASCCACDLSFAAASAVEIESLPLLQEWPPILNSCLLLQMKASELVLLVKVKVQGEGAGCAADHHD